MDDPRNFHPTDYRDVVDAITVAQTMSEELHAQLKNNIHEATMLKTRVDKLDTIAKHSARMAMEILQDEDDEEEEEEEEDEGAHADTYEERLALEEERARRTLNTIKTTLYEKAELCEFVARRLKNVSTPDEVYCQLTPLVLEIAKRQEIALAENGDILERIQQVNLPAQPMVLEQVPVPVQGDPMSNMKGNVSKAASAREEERKAHAGTMQFLVQSTKATFGAGKHPQLLHMDERCSRCGVNKIKIPDEAILKCPVCQDEEMITGVTEADMDVAPHISHASENTGSSVITKLNEVIARLNGQWPKTVNPAIALLVAKRLLEFGYKDLTSLDPITVEYVHRSFGKSNLKIKDMTTPLREAEEMFERLAHRPPMLKKTKSDAKKEVTNTYKESIQIWSLVTGKQPPGVTPAEEGALIKMLHTIMAAWREINDDDEEQFQQWFLIHMLFRYIKPSVCPWVSVMCAPENLIANMVKWYKVCKHLGLPFDPQRALHRMLFMKRTLVSMVPPGGLPTALYQAMANKIPQAWLSTFYRFEGGNIMEYLEPGSLEAPGPLPRPRIPIDLWETVAMKKHLTLPWSATPTIVGTKRSGCFSTHAAGFKRPAPAIHTDDSDLFYEHPVSMPQPMSPRQAVRAAINASSAAGAGGSAQKKPIKSVSSTPNLYSVEDVTFHSASGILVPFMQGVIKQSSGKGGDIPMARPTKAAPVHMENVTLFSWNINGLPSSKEQLVHMIDECDADVICLQETKCTTLGMKNLDKTGLPNIGVHHFTHKGAHHGVSTWMSDRCISTHTGFPAGHVDACMDRCRAAAHEAEEDVDWSIVQAMCTREGRVVTSCFEWGSVVNVYVPNSGVGRQKLRRIKERVYGWDIIFYAYLNTLKERGLPIVVIGDMNVVRRKTDIHNTKILDTCAGTMNEERMSFRRGLLRDLGFRDLWIEEEEERGLDAKDGFTFWSKHGGGVHKRDNKGWRLDYTLLWDPEGSVKLDSYTVLSDKVMGDHAPYVVKLSFRS